MNDEQEFLLVNTLLGEEVVSTFFWLHLLACLARQLSMNSNSLDIKIWKLLTPKRFDLTTSEMWDPKNILLTSARSGDGFTYTHYFLHWPQRQFVRNDLNLLSKLSKFKNSSTFRREWRAQENKIVIGRKLEVIASPRRGLWSKLRETRGEWRTKLGKDQLTVHKRLVQET